jgi:hypothetical protein
MQGRILTIVVVLLFVFSRASGANTSQTFSSGSRQVSLIEAFTSEGCSSCPPADQWISSLRDDRRLWDSVVPISFHVDYWDYIGWTDRFAKGEHADRQRRYVEQGGARFVYTPGLFLNGKEWVGWRSGEAPGGNQANVGTLTVSIDGNSVAVHFANDERIDGDLSVHIALLGMNLSTEVRAGENQGRKLRHDFVVLGLASTNIASTSTGHEAILELPQTEIDSNELAIAAWVSMRGHEQPLQSVGGYLD